MKKFLIGLVVIILALLITFITFELMSWYHFGDIPTQVVLVRLLIFFSIITAILTGILFLVKKLKK